MDSVNMGLKDSKGGIPLLLAIENSGQAAGPLRTISVNPGSKDDPRRTLLIILEEEQQEEVVSQI
jgi:hypothetical protein